jgi:transcriptional regulator with XRE-family HTH domain
MVKAGNYNNIKLWLLGDPDKEIEGLLTKRNISVEQLARAAGLSRHAVYLYINDQRRPSTEAMRRICNALGVPHEEGLRQYVPSRLGRPPGKQ